MQVEKTQKPQENLQIDVTIIPNHWYYALTTDIGRPFNPAIQILAELVSWFTHEGHISMIDGVINKTTNSIDDYLQIDSRALAKKMNRSLSFAQRGLRYLDKKGIINRYFDTFDFTFREGLIYTIYNKQYIKLIPDSINDLYKDTQESRDHRANTAADDTPRSAAKRGVSSAVKIADDTPRSAAKQGVSSAAKIADDTPRSAAKQGVSSAAKIADDTPHNSVCGNSKDLSADDTPSADKTPCFADDTPRKNLTRYSLFVKPYPYQAYKAFTSIVDTKHIYYNDPIKSDHAYPSDSRNAPSQERIFAPPGGGESSDKENPPCDPIGDVTGISDQDIAETDEWSITADEMAQIILEERKKLQNIGKTDELGHEEYKPVVRGRLLKELNMLKFEQKQAFTLLCNVPPCNESDSRFNPVVALKMAKNEKFKDIKNSIMFYTQRIEEGFKPRCTPALITKFLKEKLQPLPRDAKINKEYWTQNKHMFDYQSYHEYQRHVVFPKSDKELSYSMSNEVFRDQFRRCLEMFGDK